MINQQAIHRFAQSTIRWTNVIGIALTALLLMALSLPASATKIERVVSPSGIEFWFVRDGTVPLVSIEFAFRGGAVQDPDDKGGLAEMTVSTLDEGAGDLDGTAFHARMERKAIELQIRASRESVRGTLRTLKENQDEAFELLRLALNEPRFDQAAVERIRSQTVASLQRQSTNPNSISSRTWWANAFPNHPYGRPVSGTLGIGRPRDAGRHARLRAPRARARQPQDRRGRRHRRRDRGQAHRPHLRQAAGQGAAQAGRRRQDVRDWAAAPLVDLNVPQAVVTFGGPGIARNDPDFMAAYIVNHILGGGSFSSRLYREVREVRGLAYGVNTGLTWFEHAAVLIGGTATRADATGETIDVIEAEFRRMAADGPTEEEFVKAKTYLKGSFALNLDTSTKIASQLVQMQIDNLGIDYIDRRSAMIDAVTLADARRVAKRLLDGGLAITVVGRPKGVTARPPGG